MHETPRARLVAYGVAVLAPAVSLLVRWSFCAVLGDAVPHMTFFPAVMIAAYFGGFWPGLLATLVSAVTANYFLTEQFPSFQARSVNDVAALILFVLVATIISGLCESLHRARRRLLVNERQRAEEARREIEERFRQLAENIHEIFWILDARDDRVLYISPGYEGVWGRPRQAIYEQPRSWVESIHADDREGAIERMEQQRRGVFTDSEFRVVRPDGSVRWVRSRSFPIKDPNGNVARIAGLAEDVTERKQTEEKLRVVNARLDLAVRGTNIGIWEIDMPDGDYRQGRAYHVNIWEQLGYERPVSPTDRKYGVVPVHPDDRAILEEAMRRYLAEETSKFEVEYRVRHKDGSYRWMLTRGVAVRDAGGKPIRFVGSGVDITDRKRAEEALRESEHRWRSLIEALPQLVWTATPDGACDYFSTQWTQHTGVPASRLLGWQWLEVLHPDDREATRQFWTDSVAGRGPYDVEYRVRRVDGEYRWFKTRGVPIRDSEGGIFKWFGTCTDITGGKMAEEELRLAKETAESANRAKDEFLANVSHEIRTPMNAILGMTELALDTPLTDDQRQCLQTVKGAADNLLGIINDLLDFSKIEAGKLELEPADFSLRAALGDTLRTLATRAHTKGLELVSHVQPDVPDALVGDAGRLRQVLLNLVSNAIKFTDDGEVVVTVQQLQIADCRLQNEKTEDAVASVSANLQSAFCNLQFSVKDTGIGIPQDKQDRIFRAFEQEDTSTTRKYGGTGLGLTIAARLVDLMGGQIAVASEPGRGSTFAFTACFGRQPHQPEPFVVRPPVLLHNLPVLIVDDNATNRHILEEWLRGWRMKPVAVGDGAAAMDALGHGAASGRPYPLVLLDARMPDVDGAALAAQIRQRAELAATCIILLTSGDRPGDLTRFRAQRVNAHLLKPVQQEELLETIHRVMSQQSGARGQGPGVRAEEASAPVPSLTPDSGPLTSALRILVAEDNDFSAQLLEQLLVRRGHRVRLTTNGREALSRAEEGAFDLLLLDIHMPELDGFQVVRAVRARERTAGGHLPIVALTARSRKEDREQCLAAGMDDFLTKPIQAADLWAAIDRVRSQESGIRGQKSGAGSQESRASSSLTPDSCPLTPDSRPLPSDFGLLDPRVLLAACGGDAVILEKICQAFRVRLPDHMTVIHDALRDGDTVRLREAAHKLCGMVAAFSTVAGGVASDLEDHAAQGRLEEARPLVAQLDTMADKLVRLASSLSLETLRQPRGPAVT